MGHPNGRRPDNRSEYLQQGEVEKDRDLHANTRNWMEIVQDRTRWRQLASETRSEASGVSKQYSALGMKLFFCK